MTLTGHNPDFKDTPLFDVEIWIYQKRDKTRYIFTVGYYVIDLLSGVISSYHMHLMNFDKT